MMGPFDESKSKTRVTSETSDADTLSMREFHLLHAIQLVYRWMARETYILGGNAGYR